MDEDLGRYESAAGWEPNERQKDSWKKERDKIRMQQKAELGSCDSMLELLSASEWIKRGARKKPRAELFGPLWREGEVAVLIGESGAGKSLLAVQVAEDLARGRDTASMECVSSSICTSPSKHRKRKVLYIDFQLSTAQWTGRYSTPSPIPGKLPICRHFSKNFLRAAIDWNKVDPEEFKRDPLKFAFHSVFNKIEESGARVIIIDDITLGGAALLRPTNATARIMQTLRFWSATENLSILVLSQNHRPGSPPQHLQAGRLRKRAGSSASRNSSGSCFLNSAFSSADSVFTLNRSTFGTQYRYVKHLASRNADAMARIDHPDALGSASPEVLTFELCRNTRSLRTDEVLPAASSYLHPTINYPLNMRFLGPSSESDHLRDYAAEARERERSIDPRSKITDARSKRSVINMLMSKEYWRYLEK